MLAIDEIVDHAGLQRPRTEQRHQRDNVFEAVGLQALNQIFHATRFELEQRRGARRLDECEGLWIVQRNFFDRHRRFILPDTGGVDDPHRLVDDRQVTQAEEVELDEAQSLDVAHVELRYRLDAALFAVKRHEVRQRTRRNHHAGGVLTGAARQALERTRHVDQRAHVFFLVVALTQLWFLLERLVERHVELVRDELGNFVDIAVGMFEHTPDIAHYRFGRHGAVGNDL